MDGEPFLRFFAVSYFTSINDSKVKNNQQTLLDGIHIASVSLKKMKQEILLYMLQVKIALVSTRVITNVQNAYFDYLEVMFLAKGVVT